MTSNEVYENLVTEICSLDRSTLIAQLSNFDGDLRLDFSDEYLRQSSTETLRHLLLAALWRCRTKETAGNRL